MTNYIRTDITLQGRIRSHFAIEIRPVTVPIHNPGSLFNGRTPTSSLGRSPKRIACGITPGLGNPVPGESTPGSLLEIQFLAEVGRIEVNQPGFSQAVATDRRFLIDEVPLVALVEKALPLSWTRDPFDCLLTAHSEARRIPLCSLDRVILGRSHRSLWWRS